MAKKLYLIGIDAAPLWLVKELSKDHELKGLERILEQGYLGELESTMPPMTGPAWPTIYTGLAPAQHGVPDFFEMRSDYTPELVFYNPRKTPPFWNSLAESGKRCLVITPAMDINLPDNGNVDMITGFPLKPKTNSGYLDGLMKKEHFEGEPEIEKDMKAGKMTNEEAAGHFVKSIESRSRIAKEAIEKGDYDFVFVCFTETDRLQHFALNKPNMRELLLPVYRAIDGIIDYCIGMSEKEGGGVVVISDHGAQPIKEKFLINTWLVRKGYATIKESVMAKIGAGGPAPVSYKLRETMMKSGLRQVYDRLPHRAKGVVHRSVGAALSSAGSGAYTRLHLFDYDMGKTRAFAAISNLNVATIFINDQRFRNGTVDRSTKTALKRKLIGELARVNGNDGKRIIAGAADAEGYYGKGTGFIAPDIFVTAMPGYSLDIFNFSRDTMFMEPEPPKSGDHTANGILGVYPMGFANGFKDATIYEIAPAILDYYGAGRKRRRTNKNKKIGSV